MSYGSKPGLYVDFAFAKSGAVDSTWGLGAPVGLPCDTGDTAWPKADCWAGTAAPKAEFDRPKAEAAVGWPNTDVG